jgi:hypothetical protein
VRNDRFVRHRFGTNTPLGGHGLTKKTARGDQCERHELEYLGDQFGNPLSSLKGPMYSSAFDCPQGTVVPSPGCNLYNFNVPIAFDHPQEKWNARLVLGQVHFQIRKW